MKVITVASPDKISLSMCISFLKAVIPNSPKYRVGDMHSLMSADAVEAYVRDFLSKSEMAVFSYYAKRKIKVDPMKVIPDFLITSSDVVLWFNIYQTDMHILKDRSGFKDAYLERWNKNIQRMEQIQP